MTDAIPDGSRSTAEGPAIEDPYLQRLAERAAEEGGALRWVVVDDLDEESVELAVGPWPSVRDDGRLTFARDESEYAIVELSRDEFFASVRAARRRQHGEAATPELTDRPLRVGDVFAWAVEASHGDHAPPGGARADIGFTTTDDAALADVTLAARTLTKIQIAVAEGATIDARDLPDLRDTGAA
jgi:hypothetical protein